MRLIERWNVAVQWWNTNADRVVVYVALFVLGMVIGSWLRIGQ